MIEIRFTFFRRNGFLLLLFFFLTGLPAAHADPVYKRIGTGILYFLLTPVLLLYTLIAMFKVMATGLREKGKGSGFISIGLVLYGIWTVCAFKVWSGSSLNETFTGHSLKTIVWVGIPLFNVFGFCLLLSALFG